MSHYYYFVASLPSLAFGAKAPFPSGEFLLRAARQLDDSDIAALRLVTLSPVHGEVDVPGMLYRNYIQFVASLRKELLLLRAHRLGRRAEDYAPPQEGGGENDGVSGGAPHVGESPSAMARRAAALAFGAENPLEGELVLERSRWAFLDSLLPFQTFDFDSLVSYRIKLLIIERIASFSPDIGEGEYRRLYDGILGAWETDAASDKNQDRSAS